MNKAFLLTIAEKTLEFSLAQQRRDASLTTVSKINRDTVFKLKEEKFADDPEILVLNEDCISVLEKLHTENLNPVCLNLASDRKPGGGWTNGAMAQEESIFYRTTYCCCLPRQYYPLDITDVIYSPKVMVFRNADYSLRHKKDIFNTSFIACPGLRNPKLQNDCMTTYDYSLLKVKIELILKTAIENKHKSIVLGALGCGVFNCPVYDVVCAFKSMIAKYGKYFKKIHFAVKEDRKGTFALFNKYWNDPEIKE